MYGINSPQSVFMLVAINDTYVSNLYQWSSIIRIFYAKIMYN